MCKEILTPCAHCGELTQMRAGQSYCKKKPCRNARQRLWRRLKCQTNPNVPARVARDKATTLTCSICQQSFQLRPGSKTTRRTCYAPECQSSQKRDLGLAQVAKKHSKYIERECLVCGDPMRTPKDKLGRALYHKCETCRRRQRDDDSMRFVEVWG